MLPCTSSCSGFAFSDPGDDPCVFLFNILADLHLRIEMMSTGQKRGGGGTCTHPSQQRSLRFVNTRPGSPASPRAWEGGVRAAKAGVFCWIRELEHFISSSRPRGIWAARTMRWIRYSLSCSLTGMQSKQWRRATWELLIPRGFPRPFQLLFSHFTCHWCMRQSPPISVPLTHHCLSIPNIPSLNL